MIHTLVLESSHAALIVAIANGNDCKSALRNWSELSPTTVTQQMQLKQTPESFESAFMQPIQKTCSCQGGWKCPVCVDATEQRIAALEAEVERWMYKACANGWKEEHDRAEAAEAKLAEVVKLPRFNVEYGGEEIGMYRVATALGDFVDADELADLLKGEGK